MISKAQKALIHVAKAKIGMTDDEYRAMLSGFGVASSTELDRLKFTRVMRHFKKMGFQARPGAPNAEAYASSDVEASEARLKKKIKAMSAEMHLSRTYLDAIARRMFSVDAWIWLNADQLRRLVAVLCYHQKRTSGKKEMAM